MARRWVGSAKVLCGCAIRSRLSIRQATPTVSKHWLSIYSHLTRTQSLGPMTCCRVLSRRIVATHVRSQSPYCDGAAWLQARSWLELDARTCAYRAGGHLSSVIPGFNDHRTLWSRIGCPSVIAWTSSMRSLAIDNPAPATYWLRILSRHHQVADEHARKTTQHSVADC